MSYLFNIFDKLTLIVGIFFICVFSAKKYAIFLKIFLDSGQYLCYNTFQQKCSDREAVALAKPERESAGGASRGRGAMVNSSREQLY